MKTQKRRMKPTRFLRKYGKVLIGGVILAAVFFCAIFSSLLTDWDPEKIDTSSGKLLPGSEHLMGTDVYGRDIFARVLYGSRSTLLVAIGAQLLTTVVGTVLGLLCGYYTKVEKVLMRILDAFSTIPNLLLCLLMVSVLGAGIPNLIVAMSVNGIPGLARLIRNQVLSLREKEYIESEKAMGAGDFRTIMLHILPACFSFLLVRFSNGLSGSILSMTSLSYLGVGLDPTIASWGGMIQDGQKLLFALPHMVFYPALAICITVFGFSMLGDGLRDLLDPKLR
ncbi:MAG: ABC transporter permease [Oscillospiraceae bacterium]|nr:ABC transporter permease [Oscillospiraceae bacterium]